MALPLMMLSSITSTFMGVGAITELGVDNPEASGIVAGTAAMMAGGVLLARAHADPHWHAICEKGHADAGLDDDCARLLHVTERQRAELDALPALARELWRRRTVSSVRVSTEAFVNRLLREDNRRKETATV